MFFAISSAKKNNFPQCYQVADFYINTDEGWNLVSIDQHVVIYKGYVDEVPLDSILNKIIDQTTPFQTGNFCAIVVDTSNKELRICSDIYRSFPIYYNAHEITNLEKLSNTVYSDNIISVDSELKVNYPLKSKFDIIGAIETETLSNDEVLNYIDELLTSKILNFLSHNTLPIKVYLSGGVDSLLVYSYLQKHTDNYEVLKGLHFDYDHFWINNDDLVKKNWGYNQLHHWNTKCVLTSGTPGDEFMLRSPKTAGMFLQYHGIDINDILKPEHLHFSYFKKYLDVFAQPIDKLSIKHLYRQMCNETINDWQHWHLGNTLTWTPLRDIRIFKKILQLPLQDAIGQIVNADISRQLIEKNFPGGTKLMSPQKNYGPILKNLAPFYTSLLK